MKYRGSWGSCKIPLDPLICEHSTRVLLPGANLVHGPNWHPKSSHMALQNRGSLAEIKKSLRQMDAHPTQNIGIITNDYIYIMYNIYIRVCNIYIYICVIISYYMLSYFTILYIAYLYILMYYTYNKYIILYYITLD